MKKIGEISLAPGGLFEFEMDSDHLYISHYGTKVEILDDSLIEKVDAKTGNKSLCVDGASLFQLEEGKLVKVPAFVLKTRDDIRKSRAAEHSRLMLRKIGETFASFGVIEFFFFNNELFVIGIDDITTTIPDDKIDEEYRVNGRDISGFKGQYLKIPIEVIEARDRIRKINDANKKLKPIWKIAGAESPIVFFLKDSGELVVRCGTKEVVASVTEKIYNRTAILIRELDLGHDYLEVPVEVENAFLKLRKELALADLHLVFVCRSLLTGQDMFRLSAEVTSDQWERVKHHFEDFGEPLGFVTCEPGIVESKLGIKRNTEPDKATSATV